MSSIETSRINNSPNVGAKAPLIGLFSLVCLVVGNMIGAGLYVGGFFSLLSLKDARLVLIVWLVGGLHAICGAIAYGAIANRLPISGGEYSYLTRCVHPAVGFVAGWISIIAGFTAPIALPALLIGEYLVGSDSTTISVQMIATASIAFVAVLHCCHLKIGAWFNNAVVAIKFFCFAVFLFVGLPFVMQGTYSGLLDDATSTANESSSLAARLSEPSTLLQMVVSLFYISLAYTGFNASIYLAGEIEGPSTTNAKGGKLVSRSMLIATVLVVVLYLLLNTVFLFGMSAEGIAASGKGYVADVAKNIGGDWLAGMIRTAIVLSAATSILAMMAIGPMVYAQMAEDGRLPKFFRMSDQVPRTAIVVQGLLSIVVVWISEIKEIVTYLGLTLTACGALAVSSVWIARSYMAEQSPIKWYEHVAASIYVGVAILLLFVAGYLERERNQFYLCVGTFATGLILYGVACLRKR
jgi:amino acid transporter